jgi:hypothetical protein
MRFTIRDLLWLTALVALAFGWWLNRVSLSHRLSSVQSTLEETEANYDMAKRANRVLLGFLNARGYRESNFPDGVFAPKR